MKQLDKLSLPNVSVDKNLQRTKWKSHKAADMRITHSLPLDDYSMILLHCYEQRWSCAVQDMYGAVLGGLQWEYPSNMTSYSTFKFWKQISQPVSQSITSSCSQSANQCMTNWMFLSAHYPFFSFKIAQTCWTPHPLVPFLALSLRLC